MKNWCVDFVASAFRNFHLEKSTRKCLWLIKDLWLIVAFCAWAFGGKPWSWGNLCNQQGRHVRRWACKFKWPCQYLQRASWQLHLQQGCKPASSTHQLKSLKRSGTASVAAAEIHHRAVILLVVVLSHRNYTARTWMHHNNTSVLSLPRAEWIERLLNNVFVLLVHITL